MNKSESPVVPKLTVAVSLATILPTAVLFSAAFKAVVVSEASSVSIVISSELLAATELPTRSLKLLAANEMLAVVSKSCDGVKVAVATLSTKTKSLNLPPVTVKSLNARFALGISEKVIVTNVDCPAFRLLCSAVITTVGA